jgi:hypothetical protein
MNMMPTVDPEAPPPRLGAKPKPGELILLIEPPSFWRRLLDEFRS